MPEKYRKYWHTGINVPSIFNHISHGMYCCRMPQSMNAWTTTVGRGRNGRFVKNDAKPGPDRRRTHFLSTVGYEKRTVGFCYTDQWHSIPVVEILP